MLFMKNKGKCKEKVGAQASGLTISLILVFLLGCSGGGTADAGDGSASPSTEIAPLESENSKSAPGSGSPHADLTYADYPGNCLVCHAGQASEMLNTTHYQWLGDAPDMVNGAGLAQGKLTNAVNSYCVNILGNWPVCGSCHVGRGLRPDDTGAALENIDCLMCHSSDYASQRKRMPDGSMGVDEPSDAWVQNVHTPKRINCLACHAKAGGGDGVKRGDISLATASNSDPAFDVHMNTHGANLDCQSCHVFENHKVIGKGSDLRPTDDTDRGAEISCLTCHTGKGGSNGHRTRKVNDHVARVACQTCHIPTYAKVATETHRDWRTHHDGTLANGNSGPGHPHTETAANLTPDDDTGIGRWSRADFIARFRAMANAHHASVSPDAPRSIMPWWVYGNMTDRDLDALYAYLRTVPPARNRAGSATSPAVTR